MSQISKAAVCREVNAPVVVEEIEVESPRKGEVMLRMAACGVCHSDHSVTTGRIGLPPPIVVGHEGAGVVVEVGEGVSNLSVGDHVLSFVSSMCGHCRYCTTGRPTLCEQSLKTAMTLPDGTVRMRDRAGKPLSMMSGCGVMSQYTTVHVDNLVKIDAEMPLEQAALISCCVVTGVGAAITRAKVEPGSIAVVIGVGGVGLNVVQGCALAGARMIVAVDMSDQKLEWAKQFGATHTVNPKAESNVVSAVRKLTGGGADYSFECIGYGETVAQAYGMLARGGSAVVVGIANAADTTTLRTQSIPFEEKTLTGCYMGSARPYLDFPRLIALYRGGKLKLDELITRRYSIEEAPQAFADLAAGKNIRGVIVF